MKTPTTYRFWVDSTILVVSYFAPGDPQEQEYEIAPLALLAEPMAEDPERSQVLFSLSGRAWVCPPLLYELAAQIRHYYPANKINWLKSVLMDELDRIASQYADTNYLPQHTTKAMLDSGEMSARDLIQSNLLMLAYRRAISPSVVEATRQRIADELTRRGIDQA